MWSCFRPRCLMECFVRCSRPFPQQLRCLSDNEKAKILEAKNIAMWSKQIGELVKKRQMLSLISDYIQLQERYVESRLRSNKKLLNYAKRIWQLRKKESP